MQNIDCAIVGAQTLKREQIGQACAIRRNFRSDVDARPKACGMKFVDNVYADYVTLALTRY